MVDENVDSWKPLMSAVTLIIENQTGFARLRLFVSDRDEKFSDATA